MFGCRKSVFLHLLVLAQSASPGPMNYDKLYFTSISLAYNGLHRNGSAAVSLISMYASNGRLLWLCRSRSCWRT